MGIPTEMYDYELPAGLIAQEPLGERSSSRLLSLNRKTGEVSHGLFSDIAEKLRPGDLLVVNNTRVFPARIHVKKETGANAELLFLRERSPGLWEALARPGKRLKEGTALRHEAAPGGLLCYARKKLDDGMWLMEAAQSVKDGQGGLSGFLELNGETPLPPYVKKKISNPDRYQTVYADKTGSTAAPTAGMHFTDELLGRLAASGVSVAKVTLHIGLDTFKPVTARTLEEHKMHSEYFSVPDDTADAIHRTKAAGGRVVAVGTTSTRSLESWALAGGSELPAAGSGGLTELFIYRRDQFRVVDAMITNFHLPRTTLLAMICAFAGRDHVLAAYAEAVRMEYRFFSFGDAMYIA